MAEMTIKPCNCIHDYQDEKYGKGNRLHTVGTKKETCTVCGKEKK